MMLGMYAEDVLAKQSRQQAQAHAQNLHVGADSTIEMDREGDLNWFSEGGLLRMEEFGHDIEWVHEELDQTLDLQVAHGDSEDLFAREFSPFAPTASVVDSTPQHHPTASGIYHISHIYMYTLY